MSYIPSVNIELNSASDFRYIVTENTRIVAGEIVNSFNTGHHSFSIIGTYGTGKSSFILALEDDLMGRNDGIVKHGVLGPGDGYEFMNIVGDYASLSSILASKLNCHKDNIFDSLSSYYQGLRKQNKFLFIVIDEFGKILDFAANTNPEKELYFIQKLSEFANVPSRNIILLTTLHQNFSSYATKLSESQRNEWQKVKGRFREIVFAEPVEHLLYLTATQLDHHYHLTKAEKENFNFLYNLGTRSKILSKSFKQKTAEQLYPLDPISAVCITHAVQRYGQNERSLFSFLTAKGNGSLSEFISRPTQTYNLANIYDYLTYHFYSAITEINADTTGWRSISVAIERVEGSDLSERIIDDCLKIVKTVGLLNIFFNGVVIDNEFLVTYGENALGITCVKDIINTLEKIKVLRYAKYKSQYILYEGTNLNLESEIFKAASIVPTPQLTIDEIAPYIKQKASVASASYYKTGTPRYFEYRISNEPTIIEPTGDIDGYINLIFPLSDIEDAVKETSKSIESGASIYGYFKNTEHIIKHLYEIKKLNYVLENVAIDDRVAETELSNQKAYESSFLNNAINSSLIDGSIVWYFRGEAVNIQSTRDYNKLLSHVCDIIYSKTPIIRNELVNRQKLSSAISLARVNLLDAMLTNYDKESFGIDGFPPEKTIYYTLFKTSGIHKQDNSGQWALGEPTSQDLRSLWDASMEFINSTVDKPRNLVELSKILRTAPYKLKQGVIDFWIPIFLFINQQDFALYNGNTFVLTINKEVFELIQKRITDFSIKAFQISGVKLEFFKRYRQFLKKDDTIAISADSLIATVRPFFHFYNGLNSYAKHTNKFDNAYTAMFRNVLSDATDPAKTFFEDLPAALGYKDLNSEEFTAQYIDLIRNAIRELNSCYDNFIDRIEDKIIAHLGLPNHYDTYKVIMKSRYESIDPSILTPKKRAFLDRILAPSENKREFIEKISIVITDKRLDETRDSEEALLIHQILYMFSELERYSAITSVQDSKDDAEAFNFELASNIGSFSKSQTYRLPKSKSEQAAKVADKISSILTDDEELNICVLLKLLNQKVK